MKKLRTLGSIILVLLALTWTTASAYDVDQCCQHAGGLHKKICCAIADALDWWD